MEQNNHTNYNANEIQVLEGLEAVKRRPGMYIGSTDVRGLHHLVKELVDNAIDEAMGGYCTHIEVTIHPDNSVSVRDNGRGIPVGYHEKMHKSALEVALTVLHAGGKFGGSGYKVSGGLHGVGLSVVNALSKRLTAEVRRDGIIYRQEYVNGDPVTGVEQVGTYGDDTGSGTTITFLANDQIFDTLDYNYDTLRGRMRELAFLNKGVAITVADQRTDPVQSKKYCYEGGIISFVEHLNKSKDVLHEDVMYFEGSKDDPAKQQVASVEVAMQYNTDYNESVFTFANNINTAEGGTHLQGFRSALARSINDYARKYKLLKDNEPNLSGDDVREGLTAIVSVKLVEPQFEGQTKTKLGNSYVKSLVDNVVGNGMGFYLEEHPQTARLIIDKCITASRAREAARRARDLTRKKTGLENISLPGKLADCNSNEPEKCEIFLVEGDSAGGSAKMGRNPEFQAILPLRGKILNVEKTRLDKMLANNEIRSMITAFGTGIDTEFDESKLRYHKIVCMTDADVDGAHIRILLLTFFYRHMRPLIEHGHIYAAQPPLYRITRGKNIWYAYDDEQLGRILNEIGRDPKPLINRYKGLGEMNPDQLWETTMDPDNRMMYRVHLEDAIRADEIFSTLMGDKVEPRKEFIEQNSKLVVDLDV
ncbi:MAG: DNA topoisomerase (ATP-hydrolyzing) subunit B [Eubacteriales bacterium]|nr:DNA topoisomerase (ATP-hydrolyzing) subunit B [Eubacteriales bacterium]MDY5512174.1 DNA topoisomerase (ATP-hydrolyzing) subunit B [Eubacteriales bacterium]MDY5676022.1 DNA topoisomerase (ATP-hydrolyzing) subunit B [Eubacteriales bacterium]